MAGSAAEMLAPIADRLAPERTFALRLWDGSVVPASDGRQPAFTLGVRSPRALAYVVREPNELGLGRAWVSGELDLEGELEPALAGGEVLRGASLGLRDRVDVLRAARRLGALGLRTPEPPAVEARLSGRLPLLGRDRAAVRHHYDVSNAFYRLLLGPTMVYSCAYFASPDETLEAAQERKLDVVCRKLRLRPGERLLDVGCGWGSLVLHAADRYGAHAVGITLSEPQAELARERIRAAGLEKRCEVRVADYRELADGPYDKAASVGMAEHVGSAKLGEYARAVRSLLRPGGLFLNHAIARATPRPWNGKSFVARYVFPDGELVGVGTMTAALEAAGFELRDAESLREHYPLTLRRWLANLAEHRAEAIAEVGEERERVWRLYLTGSVAAFERGDISVHQLLLAADGAAHGFPLVRSYPDGV